MDDSVETTGNEFQQNITIDTFQQGILLKKSVNLTNIYSVMKTSNYARTFCSFAWEKRLGYQNMAIMIKKNLKKMYINIKIAFFNLP